MRIVARVADVEIVRVLLFAVCHGGHDFIAGAEIVFTGERDAIAVTAPRHRRPETNPYAARSRTD
jgi:hypothetical protein